MVSVFVHGSVVLYALTHSLLPIPDVSIVAIPPVSIRLVSVRTPQAPERPVAEPVAGEASGAGGGFTEKEEVSRPLETQPSPQVGGATEDRVPVPVTVEPVTNPDPVLQPDVHVTLPAKADTPSEPVIPKAEISPEPPSEHEPQQIAEPGMSKTGDDGVRLSPVRTEESRPDSSLPPSEKVEPAGGQQATRKAATASVAPARTRQYADSARNSAWRAYTRAYRRKVLAHLAANKPNGGMGRGMVRIAFALSRSGRLLSARVVRSSGRRALDQAALAAVRSASPFPPPPAALKGGRHRFVFPFYFQ